MCCLKTSKLKCKGKNSERKNWMRIFSLSDANRARGPEAQHTVHGRQG